MFKLKLNLRLKVIIAISVLVVGVATILSLFFISYQKQAIRAALTQRGLTLASSLAYNSEFGVLTANNENLQNFIKGVMQQPDVAYSFIQNIEGKVLASQGLNQKLLDNKAFKKISKEALGTQETKIEMFTGASGKRYFEMAVPVFTEEIRFTGDEMSLFLGTGADGGASEQTVTQSKIGIARIGLSLAGAELLEKKSQQAAIVITGTIIIIAGLLTTLLTGIAIVPIRNLVEGTHRIARGELDFKVQVKSMDELGLLAASFNKMTEDLRRSRNELVHAKEYTDNIINSMIDILVVADPKGILKTVNPATSKILGYQENELIGEPIDVIFSHREIDPNPRVHITKQMLREGFLTGFEMNFRKKDGSVLPVLVSGAVMMNNDGEVEGIVGIAKDISDRKEAEKALMESNERFETLANNMPGMIYQFVLNPDGTSYFPYVSPGSKELFHLEPEVLEADANVVIEKIHPEDREKFDKSILVSSQRLEPWQWEGRFLDDEGQTRWVRGASRPKRIDGGATLWDGLLIDVSERKVAESLLELKTKMLEKVNHELIDNETKLKTTIGDLQKAHDELKKTQFQLIQAEKLKVIGRLASGVAHEVKNPLAIILQGVSFLSKKLSKEDKVIAQVTEDINIAVKRADAVIKGVLDFSALSELDMELVNINDIIDKSLLLVKHEFNINKVEVVKVASKLLPKVTADQNKIEQVLVNILMNAVQSMKKGGTITIKTYPKKIAEGDVDEKDPDHFELDQEVVCINIEDTGPGIPPENLKNIFEPFFTTKGGEGGTGLGLPIIKNIVDLHKGKISIENRKEGGVQATIMLRT